MHLRTLHIDSEMGWSGGQVQVSGLCSYLHEHGHGVRIVCPPKSELESWARTKGLACSPVPMPSSFSLPAVMRLRSVVADESPDVVHLHASRAHVLGSAGAALARARVVVVTRRMDHPVKMIWPNTSAYGRWTTAVVAISRAVRDALISSGVDPDKIRVIESGADVERFASAAVDPEIRKSLGVGDGVPLVCTAASLTERKGISYLLEASAILKDEGSPIHVIVAGDGPIRKELEAHAQELGVDASFVGFYGDMPALIASADVFVMPSLAEGLGVAAIEAMAGGRPVVASAVGGLAESVIDGKTGFLVPPADARAFADALRRLLSNPELAESFSSAGRARVRENYSLNNMASRNEALYFELLDGC